MPFCHVNKTTIINVIINVNIIQVTILSSLTFNPQMDDEVSEVRILDRPPLTTNILHSLMTIINFGSCLQICWWFSPMLIVLLLLDVVFRSVWFSGWSVPGRPFSSLLRQSFTDMLPRTPFSEIPYWSCSRFLLNIIIMKYKLWYMFWFWQNVWTYDEVGWSTWWYVVCGTWSWVKRHLAKVTSFVLPLHVFDHLVLNVFSLLLKLKLFLLNHQICPVQRVLALRALNPRLRRLGRFFV